MTDIVIPTPLPPSPPVPQRSDPATFEDRFDGAWAWMMLDYPAAADQAGSDTYQNATASYENASAAWSAAWAASGPVTTIYYYNQDQLYARLLKAEATIAALEEALHNAVNYIAVKLP